MEKFASPDIKDSGQNSADSDPAQSAGETWPTYHKAIVTVLFCSTFINYLDRQTLSIIAPLLRDQFSLSNVDYSRIIFVFLLGFTISQAFVGRLIDVIGTRLGMALCVAVWSAAAMSHSLASGFYTFCAARLLLGIAEAGNWPGAIKAISETLPVQRRAFAIGIFNSGSFVGAILAPPIVVALVQYFGWRSMFVVVGVSGFAWIWAWLLLSHGHESRPSTLVPGARSRTLGFLTRRETWGVMVGRMLADPVWWFYAFWLPEYMVRSRGFELSTIGRVLWIPFVFAALGSGVGGYSSGMLVGRGMTARSARKVIMICGATLMLCGVPAFLTSNRAYAVALICVVLFGYSAWATNILTLVPDIFPASDVAEVTGLAGTAGALGGMLFTLATGWLVQKYSYAPVFALAAAMIICAALAVTLLVRNPRLPRSTFAD